MSESISIPAGAPPGFEDIEPAPMTEIGMIPLPKKDSTLWTLNNCSCSTQRNYNPLRHRSDRDN